VTCFDAERLGRAYALAGELRLAGLRVIVYPEAVKLQKQLKFADRTGVRFVLIAGPDEDAAGLVTVKDLSTMSQESLAKENLAEGLIKKLAEA